MLPMAFSANNVRHKLSCVLVFDLELLTTSNNIEMCVMLEFLKRHKCVLWMTRQDLLMKQMPPLYNIITGLVNNTKNIRHLRKLFRSDEEFLKLPSVFIDTNCNYLHNGHFDFAFDLQKYKINLPFHGLNMSKLIADIEESLAIWYNINPNVLDMECTMPAKNDTNENTLNNYNSGLTKYYDLCLKRKNKKYTI